MIDGAEAIPDRSEVSAREEQLFKGTSKPETMSNSRMKEQSSLLVKQGMNAIMSSKKTQGMQRKAAIR